MHRATTFTLASLCLLFCGAGADWLRFRGPNGLGVADDQRVPVSWSTDTNRNVDWKTKLPGRGSSCPIVIGDRVVLTCASGYRQDRLHVVCLDVASGQHRWERQLWATGRTQTHPSICPAAPTPVSDGERIYATFSTHDLACYDLDGNLLWLRGLMLEYPNASNSLGMASSPIIVDGVLVVQLESDSQSLALGLDTQTGATLWQVDRPQMANWTSPVVLQADAGDSVVILQSSAGVSAYDPRLGQELWHYDRGAATQPSSVTAGSVAFVPSNGLVALRQTPNAEPYVVWQNARLGPSTPTPLLYEGRVYVISGSVLKCADAATGELLWPRPLRLKGRRFSGSPVAAAGHLYLFNDDGLAQVVELGDKSGRVVSSSDFGEPLLASPAIADGALYVRSDAHVWKIAATATGG